jgi:hypothetical protein
MAKETVGIGACEPSASLEERLRTEIEFFRSLRKDTDVWRAAWAASDREGHVNLLVSQAEQMQEILEQEETLNGLRGEWNRIGNDCPSEERERLEKLALDLASEMESLLGTVRENLDTAGGLREECERSLEEVRKRIRADESYQDQDTPTGTYFMDRKA